VKVYQLVEGCIKFIPLPSPKKLLFNLDQFKLELQEAADEALS
jgi:hypothetical protein